MKTNWPVIRSGFLILTSLAVGITLMPAHAQELAGVTATPAMISGVAIDGYNGTFTNITVTSPTEATAASAFLVISETGLDHWGRYLDSYGVFEGSWCFVHRREFLDGSMPDSWAEFATERRRSASEPEGARPER